MSRIIAGIYAGRALKVPEQGTRPTTDRVREAVFSSLESRKELPGSMVLDLFAGSGALALEALSRGAAKAEAVESANQAVRTIKHNATMLNIASSTSTPFWEAEPASNIVSGKNAAKTEPNPSPTLHVHQAKVETFLHNNEHAVFDVVFCDPPYTYNTSEINHILKELTTGTWLNTDALIIVERAKRSPAPNTPPELNLLYQKIYGDTTIYTWKLR